MDSGCGGMTSLIHLLPVVAGPLAVAPPALETFLPLVIGSVGRTLLLTAIAVPIALCGGWSLARLREYGERPDSGVVRWAAGAAILVAEGIRRVPLLLLMGMAFYLIGRVPLKLAPFTLAALLLGVHHAALLRAGPRRAGILTPEGGVDGADPARASDLEQRTTDHLADSFLGILRDTALASFLTVTELTRASTITARESGSIMIAFGVAVSLYLLMSLPLTWLGDWLEKQRRVRRDARP